MSVCSLSSTMQEHVPVVAELSSQTLAFFGGVMCAVSEVLVRGLAVSPRKPRVPHCEERPGAVHSRRDQKSVLPGCVQP